MNPISLTRLAHRTSCVLSVLYLLCSVLDTNAQTQTFTTSGTYTVPAGVTSITVECWGGGGGGGGASHSGSGNSRGGGGGGGSYSRKTLTVTSGQTLTVTVGSGGAAATAGGDSWVSTNTTVLAKGGPAGSSGNKFAGNGGSYGASPAGNIGDLIYLGGNGAAGQTSSSGGGGGGAGSTGAGNAASASTGGAAKSNNGGAGANGVTTNANGNTGSNYGGGGSGAYTSANGGSQTGGAGAPGYVQITALSLTITSQNINCRGGLTGSITVSPTTGTAPYTYSWSPSSAGTTATVSGLAAGTYTVTVTDANNLSRTQSVTLTQPAASLSATSSAGSIACNGGSTTVTVSASGGTAPYTGTGSFTRTAGAYSYTVTDANSCTATTSGTISQPTALSATSSAGTIACNGGSTTVTVSASGGTAPYTGTGSFTRTAGAYSYTVTDANSCTASVSGTILEPSAISGSSSVTACISYSWNGNTYTSSGTYTATLQAANGCDSSATLFLTITPQPQQPSIACYESASFNTTTCSWDVTGTQPAAPTGLACYETATFNTTSCSWVVTGTQPTQPTATNCWDNYQFNTTSCTWVNAGSQPVQPTATNCWDDYQFNTSSCTWVNAGSQPTQPTATNCWDNYQFNTSSCMWVNAGSQPAQPSATNCWDNYQFNTSSCTWVNAGSQPAQPSLACYQTASFNTSTCQWDVTGTPLTASASAGTIICGSSSATVTVSASGGTAPYSGTGSYTVTAGTYAYTVTDANGCTSATSITISEPAALSASSTSGSIACNGGSTTVTVSATGGTTPYTGTGSFTVTAGTYSYTVTDANGCTSATSITVGQPATLAASSTTGSIACNGGSTTVTVSATGGTSPYSGTGTFTRTAGAYSYTVTDMNGCTSVTTGTISQPTQLVASSSATTIACSGGTTTITVSATGGTAPYSGTGTFTRSSGSYSYTVTDANGCTSVTTGTVSQPSVMVASSTAGTIACFGGTTTVTVSVVGGTAPYTGAGAQTVSAGPYSFTVTDSRGCTASTSGTVTQPTLLVASSTPGTIACFGGTTTVAVSATGGTTPYSGTGSFTAGAGSYSYTVTDARGCTATTSGTLTQPALLRLLTSTNQISCFGGTGSVTLTSSGGTSPYTYGATPTSGLSAGTYNYTVTDSRGCTATASATINAAPAQVVLTATATQISCFGGTGSVALSATGGVSPYTYGGSATTALVAGTYSYTVTDANGCTASTSATINAAPSLLVASSTAGTFNCSTGSAVVTISATGGTSPYTGTGSQTSGIGSYSFTVTDAKGCTATTTGTISLPSRSGSVWYVNDNSLTGDLLTSATGSDSYNGTIGCPLATINTAIGLAVAGDTIMVDAGTYDARIDLNKSLKVMGANKSVTILKTTAAVGEVMQIGSSSGMTMTGGALVQGFTFQGASAMTTPRRHINIRARGADASNKIIIRDNIFDGSGFALTYGEAIGTNALANTGDYILVDGNQINGLKSYGCNMPVLRYSQITGNTINNAGLGAIVVTSATANSIRDIAIQNNVVYGASRSSASNNPQHAAISLAAIAYNVQISNNSIDSSLSYGIVIQDRGNVSQTLPGLTNVTVNNNSITRTTRDAITTFVTTSNTDIAWFTGTVNATCNYYGVTSATAVDAKVNGDVNFTPWLSNGVTDSDPAVGYQPASGYCTGVPVAVSLAGTNVACFGNSTGAVNLTVTAGAAPYSYSWSNGATTEDLSGVAAGSYSVTVTDVNGSTASGSVTITQPASSVVAAASSGSIACNGGSTTVT
ncbi:MAG: hypothetical protein ACKO1U_05035, partial [Bacteroidota bacterium]